MRVSSNTHVQSTSSITHPPSHTSSSSALSVHTLFQELGIDEDVLKRTLAEHLFCHTGGCAVFFIEAGKVGGRGRSVQLAVLSTFRKRGVEGRKLGRVSAGRSCFCPCAARYTDWLGSSAETAKAAVETHQLSGQLAPAKRLKLAYERVNETHQMFGWVSWHVPKDRSWLKEYQPLTC
eukprot:227615-Pelagomonas_calceolata.AAC.5